MSDARQFVYKVLPRSDWHDACRAGSYAGSADDRRDGFIHLSLLEQLSGTLAKHFRGQGDLVLVQFVTDALGAALRWEASRGGALFPHLYGDLPLSAVGKVEPLPLGSDGRHAFPPMQG